jgi:hypothetical protein
MTKSGRERFGPVIAAIAVLLHSASGRAAIAAEIAWTCAETTQSNAACGLATCPDTRLTSADALAALRSAVGMRHCALCRCDADGSGSVSATDAVRILKAAAGQNVEIVCPSCVSLTPIMENAATAISLDVAYWSRFRVASAGDGSVVFAWNGPDALHVGAFDRELSPKFEPLVLTTESQAGSAVSSFVLCGASGGGMIAAWTLATQLDQPIPHDYPNLGDAWFARVTSSGEASPVFPVNGEDVGTQAPIGIDCVPADGTTRLIWISRCEGMREFQQDAFTPFSPEGCPDDGIYTQTFTADGSASGISEHVTMPTHGADSFYARVAPLRDGGMVLDAAGRHLRLSATGHLDNIASGDAGFGSLALDCGAGIQRCVHITWAPLVVKGLDGNDPGRTSETLLLEEVLVESSTPGPEPSLVTVGPSHATTACDVHGFCVIVWVRERRSFYSDYESSDSLNIVAQAFDVFSGELGQQIELFQGAWVGEASPSIVNVAERRFVLALRTDSGTISLRSLKID